LSSASRLLPCHVSFLDYQIKVGNRYNEKWSLQKKCIYFQADFMNLPVADNSFDAAYQIEATCHAPDKAASYEKIFNALKPGGCFSGYEWVMLDKVRCIVYSASWRHDSCVSGSASHALAIICQWAWPIDHPILPSHSLLLIILLLAVTLVASD